MDQNHDHDVNELGGGLSDVPLILEDLWCQIEDLREAGGGVEVIADLLVELLQGR